ncbi:MULTISPECIES: hypothetical protein [unclassified Rhizobium]|uniref:hypothetical protein n=2 Tax=unclassified Rhizobium TaxID=2613769 RepID=UPI001C832FB7|nr:MULTISPECIES: hypothetical protein [unclassified Rhizobium]MBX5171951.1 hypothetical protein [Rhizobium sp. NZLR1b]MBX5191525.1 hypothetical protein [Rhizobium sp. NZLR3b]MBX5207844.1 hypothetical protein [Rhizobium sp. NZLR11]
MVNMDMPPLVDGISGGEDWNCSDVLTAELDRWHSPLIPNLGSYFFKLLKMFFDFYRVRLTARCMQKTGVDVE